MPACRTCVLGTPRRAIDLQGVTRDHQAPEIERLRDENERLRKQLEEQAERIADLEPSRSASRIRPPRRSRRPLMASRVAGGWAVTEAEAGRESQGHTLLMSSVPLLGLRRPPEFRNLKLQCL